MYDVKAIYEAKTIQEAIRLRVEHPEARIIAGGSDMLIKIREGKAAGTELISIYGIEEMRGISLDPDGTLRIGSLTSFKHITKHPLIKKYIPVLGEAVDQVGGPQIRSIGTIGGNTCNGVTSADSASTLMAWDAVIELQGPEGKRLVPDREFYLGPGRADIRPGEIQTAILISKESYLGYRGNYIKYGMRNAMEIATTGCSVNVRLSPDQSTVEDIRIAYGVAAPVPVRAENTEKAVRGLPANEETAETIFQLVLQDVTPRDSWRASRAMRLHLCQVMAKRAFLAAVNAAKAGVTNEADVKEDLKKEIPRDLPANACTCGEREKMASFSADMPITTAADGKQFKVINCRINGVQKTTMVDVRASLTDLLRKDYRLTSVKEGCEVGECGACAVIIDGECYNACIYLAIWADGKDIVTLEGLAGPHGEISELQKAFIDETAVQCGFCIPGFILEAKTILDSGKHYTDEELRKLLSGHLCRCTGYENILNAVRKAMVERLEAK